MAASISWRFLLVTMAALPRLYNAACPSTTVAGCGECPSSISDDFSSSSTVQIVGNRNMRCTVAGIEALSAAGCPEGSCFNLVDINVPFSYANCATSQSTECVAWRWLHCAFPDDRTASGTIMHGYFFVDNAFQGEGFAFANKNVADLLQNAGASTASCTDAYPNAASVVAAKLSAGESKALVLFGWDGCSCTAVAQARFRSRGLCYEQLTWSNSNSDIMKYLQCREGDSSHHSFVYFRSVSNGAWTFKGTGFSFDVAALTEGVLTSMIQQAGVGSGCVDEFALSVYGEALSECRAAQSDSSGSWMWDGKCTEEGGGVHQICMDRLPADFSVTTGQGPWSETRADRRHCVCIGAWSLYMTREADPAFATTQTWPFCDAVPLSALTTRYLGKWKDWNGIPAQITLGASKLLSKCLQARSGPGSARPSSTAACHLVEAFKALQQAEPDLGSVDVDGLAAAEGFDCSAGASAQQALSPSSTSTSAPAPAPTGGGGRDGGSGSWSGDQTAQLMATTTTVATTTTPDMAAASYRAQNREPPTVPTSASTAATHMPSRLGLLSTLLVAIRASF